MKRFLLALKNELKFARTAIPIHIVAVIQPTIMYLLMAVILVDPTFPMNVSQPNQQIEWELVDAMRSVGSPIGKPYIDVNLIEESIDTSGLRQVVTVEQRAGVTTAVQYYGLIDSNIVKNYRNRLTAAALNLWNTALGDQAVTIEEHPWLPQDVPYKVYFGMALLPMAAAIAASITGAILTAQEFERGTILQYRLSPTSPALILGARLTRLVLTGLLSAGVLLTAVGIVTGYWPAALWKVVLIILPMGVITGGLGIIAGLVIQKTIPSFMIALITSFISWIIGSAFGLAAGFGRGYAIASLFTPNAYAVELLFPRYFGTPVGNPMVSITVLVLMSVGMISFSMLVYYQRVTKQE
jgi:hypothetical protein